MLTDVSVVMAVMMLAVIWIHSSILCENILLLRNVHFHVPWYQADGVFVTIFMILFSSLIIISNFYTPLPIRQFTYQSYAFTIIQPIYIGVGFFFRDQLRNVSHTIHGTHASTF